MKQRPKSKKPSFDFKGLAKETHRESQLVAYRRLTAEMVVTIQEMRAEVGKGAGRVRVEEGEGREEREVRDPAR